jgi:hypothetical protein
MNRAKEFLFGIMLTAMSVAACVVAFEVALGHGLLPLPPLSPQGYLNYKRLAEVSTIRRGGIYDQTPASKLVEASRKQGQRAFLAISPSYYLEGPPTYSKVVVDGKPMLPLGIAPLSRNYYCNESGSFAIFDTDRFGLRNPDAVWDDQADIVATGDSFTFGACLDEADSIVGNIRHVIGRTVNLGSGANGPLIELATIKEFVPTLKPKAVVWLFFPNDLDDLKRERENPLLAAYLDPDHSQNLVGRRMDYMPAVQQVADNYYQAVRKAEAAAAAIPAERWFTLPHLRALLSYTRRILSDRREDKPDVASFKTVLAEANRFIRANASELFFVYLPDCLASSYGQSQWKTELLSGVRNLGVRVIDVEPAIDRTRASGQDPFFFCHGSHFSAAGAKAAASEILGAIAEARDMRGKLHLSP